MSAPRDDGNRKRGWLLVPVLLVRDIKRAAMSRFRLSVLRQRERLIRLVGEEHPRARPRQRVLVAVTHVVVPADLASDARRATRAQRLATTIECALASLAQHDVSLLLNTYREMHVLDFLQPWQRERLEVVEHAAGDPMFIEFHVQDLFLARKDRFDWFLFLEDDIQLVDACFLEKIDEFNRLAGDPNALLIPHRYELDEGRKHYVDRDFRNAAWGHEGGTSAEDVVNRLTTLSCESAFAGRKVFFAEFTNPHAACYCLTRSQLERWDRTGRTWRGKVSWIGPLESAATGSLFERFDLYKPHPENKWYLEVRHAGSKYSDIARGRT